MAGHKKAKIATRNMGQSKVADDGERYIVVRNGRQVYPGSGVSLADAQRLAGGLAEPAEIVKAEQAAQA